jgi:hypothetical protein
VVEKYSRSFLRGDFHTVGQAAGACQQELDRLSAANPRSPWLTARRPISGIYAQVLKTTTRLGRRKRE